MGIRRRSRTSGTTLVSETGISHAVALTRASTATYFDGAGVLRTAAINEPRFDTNPGTLARLGLRIEAAARTNLCLQSEDLSTTWLATRCSVVTNQAAAPDGATTMDKVIGLAVPVAFANVSQAIVSEGSTQYSFSAFLKKSTSIKMLFLIAATSTTWDKTVNFDTGALEAGSNTAPDDAVIENMGGGIYRVTITVTTGVADLTLTPTAYIVPDGGSWASNSGVNDGFLMWGMQVEKGATRSSYIPTTTAAVTRAADVASAQIADLAFSQSPMTYLIHMDIDSILSTNTGMWVVSISESTVGNAHDLAFDDGTESLPRIFVYENYVAVGNITAAAAVARTPFKIAWTVALNDVTVSKDGGAVVADTAVATLPTTLSVIKFGLRGDGSAPFMGHISRFTFFPNSRLPNEYLVGVTK